MRSQRIGRRGTTATTRERHRIKMAGLAFSTFFTVGNENVSRRKFGLFRHISPYLACPVGGIRAVAGDFSHVVGDVSDGAGTRATDTMPDASNRACVAQACRDSYKSGEKL